MVLTSWWLVNITATSVCTPPLVSYVLLSTRNTCSTSRLLSPLTSALASPPCTGSYTFTPTAQKANTSPRPPATLAAPPTINSRFELSFPSLLTPSSVAGFPHGYGEVDAHVEK